MKCLKSQSGMSLVEVLVGLAVSSIVMLIIASGVQAANEFYGRYMDRTESEEDVELIVDRAANYLHESFDYGLGWPSPSGASLYLSVRRDLNSGLEETVFYTTCEMNVNFEYSIDTGCGVTCPPGSGPQIYMRSRQDGGAFREPIKFPPKGARNRIGSAFCAEQTNTTVTLRVKSFLKGAQLGTVDVIESELPVGVNPLGPGGRLVPNAFTSF